ncbi:hypothetical protein CSKR_111181 [Clonorchis sinensis]|uniref:Uncharacterized protein n=1 Tax=Clonorchis sinensis TaxID=79923 RepID=A0A3R7G5R0_CLOSI|nr:hypothetical protein CSKR_111181 [Clonorchis sinensis]
MSHAVFLRMDCPGRRRRTLRDNLAMSSSTRSPLRFFIVTCNGLLNLTFKVMWEQICRFVQEKRWFVNELTQTTNNGKDRRITHKQLVADSCGFSLKSETRDKIFHRCKSEKQRRRDLLPLIIRCFDFASKWTSRDKDRLRLIYPRSVPLTVEGFPYKRTSERNIKRTVNLVDTHRTC